MELYYINSINQKLDFTCFPYLVRDIEELTDFRRGYEINSHKISFYDSPAEIPITLNISADTSEEYRSAVNYFFEVTEYDVINNAEGRLYYNNQYVACNLAGSKKKDWMMGVCYMMNYIRLVVKNPYWITEQKHEFLKPTEGFGLATNLDFPYEFPYEYLGSVKGIQYLNNNHFSACNFTMYVYGPCINPRIMIGNHLHEAKVNVDKGEYLIVDSRSGTLKRIRMDGQVVNEFNSRNKEYSIFEKIVSGDQLVSWDGNFGFDITLYQERGEPKWM